MTKDEIDRLTEKIYEWSSMPFFPTDELGRKRIVMEVMAMAGDVHKARWIVDQCVPLFNSWPGLAEIRAIFCHRYPPADGVMAYSQIYPNEIPESMTVGYKVRQINEYIPLGREEGRLEARRLLAGLDIDPDAKAM